MKALSIGRRFLALNSGSFFFRSARVGEPSPVHTMASSASRATSCGCRCANKARATRLTKCHKRAMAACRGAAECRSQRETVVRPLCNGGIVVALFGRAPIALHVHAPAIEAAASEPVHDRGIGPAVDLQIEGRL